ncbi:hypothetical protein [Rhodoferax sp. U11-2br]|uniref:hypothetical protein n=1 Tax=Rhodoferax sp. U11-2br TaxID=2838878 RepID=UPI001BEB2652|nr:hypothetical protein [Rhodoferax sp. U11-2br]MBT3068758.1 hypothetical protein [Rhodoferax sp. U11-2br]
MVAISFSGFVANVMPETLFLQPQQDSKPTTIPSSSKNAYQKKQSKYMLQHSKQQDHISQGQLAVLALNMAGTFAAMVSAHAQQSISGAGLGQNWSSGDFLIDSTDIICGTSTGGQTSGATLGTLTKQGISSTDNIDINNSPGLSTRN